MFNYLTSPLLASTEKSLKYSVDRQSLILDNIANIDTPGHTYRDLDFKSYIQKQSPATHPGSLELSSTDHGHLPRAASSLKGTPSDISYANTSIEQEMTKLMESSLMFETMVRFHNMDTDLIKTAIYEGRR